MIRTLKSYRPLLCAAGTLLLAVSLSFSTLAAEPTDFAGGTGTAENPYLIETTEHLDNVRKYLDAHFLMTEDIVFSDSDFAETGAFCNGGQGWAPIGDATTPFTGSFDGGGYAIEGLHQTLAASATVYAGLFGYTSDAEIKNLRMEDNDFTVSTTSGSLYAGGIVGYAASTNITNCCHVGTVFVTRATSTGCLAGGMAGFVKSSDIIGCCNAGTIHASTFSNPTVGSMAGGAAGCHIIDCYNIGTVGAAASHSGAAYVYIEPFVARRYANIGSDFSGYTVQTSYSVGKLIGREEAADYEDYCVYYDDEGICRELSAQEMCSQTTYQGFDFTDVWQMGNGGTYLMPVLRGLYQPSEPENTTDFAGGTGMIFDPYLVSEKAHLDHVRHYPNAYFKLTSDIAFADDDFAENGSFYNAGQGWISIGDADLPFAGTFDGNGHTISGLHQNITTGSTVYFGLFGCANGIEVKDLTIEDSDISATTTQAGGDVYGGFIAGYTTSGTITNCRSTGKITVPATKAGFLKLGGILGTAVSGINITDCTNAGSITATTEYNAYIGGILGEGCDEHKASAAIVNCRNAGSVSSKAGGGSGVGGILGEASNDSYTDLFIEKCVNTGSVSSSGYIYEGNGSAGGILGSGSACEVSACYNAGPVTNTQYENIAGAGGIVGSTGSGSFVENCYNTAAVSATIVSSTDTAFSGGIVGSVNYSASVRYCYNIGTVKASAQIKGGLAYSGGIVGKSNGSSNTVAGCYYLNNCALGVGTGTSTGTITSCTDAQMQSAGTFTAFDFTKIWQMGDGASYPYPVLKSLPMVTGYAVYTVGEDSVPVTVTLTASYARTLFLVCAAYDEDGRMLSCADATITCPDPAAAQIVLPGSCADADSIRVFLLNDSDTYRPVADSIAAVKSS